jgi:hypothetical protein
MHHRFSNTVSETPRLPLAVALGVLAWTALRHWGYRVDDTFIALRYARHLVEGHGLVFNPGERVEGYTSLPLVLLGALFLRVGVDPVQALTALAAAAAVATLLLAAGIERTLGGPDARGARLPLSVLLLLATPAFAYWAFRALETTLFTSVLLAALALGLRELETRRWRGSGLLFACLALTRPEGAYLFLLSTAALLLAEGGTSHGWRHARRHALNAVLVGAVLAAYLLWRSSYYGELLPNTFFAKVTGGAGQLATGLRYLRDFVLAAPLLAATLLLPIALVAGPVRTRIRSPALALALHAVALGYVAYVVAVGADFMPFFRFFVPALPLVAVLAALGLRAVPLPERSRGAVLASLVVLHGAAGLATEQPYRAFVAHRTALVGQRVGEWLAGRLAPGDWIAVNTAGAVPYFSRLPAIDMLGLTDAQIARRPVYIVSEGWAGHRRGWGEYVLSRRPRAILWYNSAGLAEPHYLSDHELAADPRFRFFYELRSATLPPSPGAPDSPIRRFLGFPFGYDASGESAIPDLGVRLRFRDGPLGWTTFSEGPLRIVYFEFDVRDVGLWQEGLRRRGDVGGFVDEVVRRWRSEPRPEQVDAAARLAVETLCTEARGAIERGDLSRARVLLGEAASRNREARSPLVPQYVANLAFQTGELWTAIAAQKEALRLDPGNPLYRDNLVHLLRRGRSTGTSTSGTPPRNSGDVPPRSQPRGHSGRLPLRRGIRYRPPAPGPVGSACPEPLASTLRE